MNKVLWSGSSHSFSVPTTYMLYIYIFITLQVSLCTVFKSRPSPGVHPLIALTQPAGVTQTDRVSYGLSVYYTDWLIYTDRPWHRPRHPRIPPPPPPLNIKWYCRVRDQEGQGHAGKMDDEKQHLRQRWQNNPKNDPTSQNNQSNSQPNNAQNFTESLNQNIDGPPVNSGPQANVQCYNSATEYSQAVHQWLVQYHMWHQMSWFYMTFPMHMMQMSLMQRHQALYSGEASGVPTQTPPRSHSQSASNAAQPAAATPTQAQQPGQTQAGNKPV